jgi:Ca2+-binding RTX toxin-like protein
MTATRIHVIAAITAIVIAATAITTTLPAAAQQSTIHIIKHGSNSYAISGGSSTVGSFDTTYTIAGERSAIRSAENLIITTITDDFRTSPTIGYVRAGGTGTTTGTDATLPSPFASHEQITERITTELRRVISEAESSTSQGQHVEIKCDFGMTLDEMRCHHGTLPQAGQ